MSSPRVDDILLVAYLDGELAPEAVAQLDRLLAEDEPTARRLEALRRSSGLLREALAEEGFAGGSVRLPPVPARPSPRFALVAGLAGLAAGLSVAILVLRPAAALDPATAVLEEVADYHSVFARESEHLVEVPASRREHIEAWLGERVGLPLVVPDLSNADLRFEGARMLVVDGTPVAQLMYTGRGGERVALCASRLDKQAKPRTEYRGEGLHLVGVAQGGHLFIVAGDDGNPLVASLAGRLPGLMLRAPA